MNPNISKPWYTYTSLVFQWNTNLEAVVIGSDNIIKIPNQLTLPKETWTQIMWCNREPESSNCGRFTLGRIFHFAFEDWQGLKARNASRESSTGNWCKLPAKNRKEIPPTYNYEKLNSSSSLNKVRREHSVSDITLTLSSLPLLNRT